MSANSPQEDEFFVGYLAMPPRTGRFLRLLVIPALLLLPAAAAALIEVHEPYPDARSDFRDTREFEGILLTEPAPHLVVPRPQSKTFSRYFLVGRGKYGAKPEITKLAGGWVRLTGSLIYRDENTLISVKTGEAIEAPANAPSPADLPAADVVGEFTLRGEIVDSKCYFGTMRPGNTKVHRGCAVRCIAGGVPPVLLVRDQDGNALYFFLVSASGEPVNERVLDHVAEPVEITGEVRQQDDIFVLYADPDTYRRL